MTATSEGEMTAAEKQAFFAPYAAFGLCYDAASDEMVFQGQRVRPVSGHSPEQRRTA